VLPSAFALKKSEALDVLYGHFLLRHWNEFTDADQNTFISEVNTELQDNEDLMTPDMSRTTRHMVSHAWFGSYRDLNALDRAAARIGFQNSFAGIINEIRPLHSGLKSIFIIFYIFRVLQKELNKVPCLFITRYVAHFSNCSARRNSV